MTLRPSKYLLVSPRRYHDESGQCVRVAYSARQAKMFVVDETTADRLTTGKVQGIAPESLSRLTGLDAIVDAQEDELDSVLRVLRAGSADPSVRSFSILPTSFCNMACAYCGQEHFKQQTDRAKLERTAARVESALADPAIKRVEVGWFGGEPMLALPAMRELSARFTAAADATGKTYISRMPTNGSLLTRHTMRILHDEIRLTHMVVTLDGPEAVHDRRRLKRNGVGSFRRTIEVLAEAVRECTVPGMAIGIRINIDSENEEQVDELIYDLSCAGLASRQVELQLMPVHSWGNDVSAVEIAARRYAQLEIRWFRLAHSLGLRTRGFPTGLKRTTCKATTAYSELVDQRGRVYSCSEHPLVPGVQDSGVVATIEDLQGVQPRPLGMFDDWYDQVEDGQQQCGRCPLLPVCGGACPKLWREGHVPCPSIKYSWIEMFDLAAPGLGLRPAKAV